MDIAMRASWADPSAAKRDAKLYVDEPYCATCKIQTQLKSCQKCRSICYCSSTCQRSDWPRHKLECAALVEIRLSMVEANFNLNKPI